MSALATIAQVGTGAALISMGDFYDGGALIAGVAMQQYGKNTGKSDIAQAGMLISTVAGVNGAVNPNMQAGGSLNFSEPAAAPTISAPIADNAIPNAAATAPDTAGITNMAETPPQGTGAFAQQASANPPPIDTTSAVAPSPTGALAQSSPPTTEQLNTTLNAPGNPTLRAGLAQQGVQYDNLGNPIAATGQPASLTDMQAFQKYSLYSGAAQGVGAAVGGLVTSQSNEKIAADKLAFEQQQADLARANANAPMKIGTYQNGGALTSGISAVAAPTNAVTPIKVAPIKVA